MKTRLSECWQSFNKEALDENTPDPARAFLRSVFYSGARSAFVIMTAYAEGKVSKEDGIRLILKMQEELNLFSHEMTQAAKRGKWEPIQ